MKKSRKKNLKKSPQNIPETKSSKNKMPIIIGIIIAGVIGSLAIFLISDSNVDSSQIMGNTERAQAIIDGCTDDVHCAVEELQSLSKQSDRDTIIRLFEDLIYLYDAQVPCHETGHHLGLWFYGYVSDVKESLEYAKQLCGGSIFHGVIQNYLMTLEFAGTAPDSVDISQICNQTPENYYSIERWQCLHGIGHGLANLYNFDILSAIKRCDEFDPGWEQISCSKGIFMQNVVKQFETNGGDFDENDKFYPCNQVAQKSMAQCLHYHATYLLLENDGRLKPTFDYCDQIIPKEIVKYCYYGVGRQVSANIDGDIQNAILFCTLGSNSEYHSYCFRGMVLTTVNQGDDPSLGFEFCSLIPSQYKADCYDALGQWILMIAPSETQQTILCLKAENQEYRDICKNASLDGIDHL